jgi:hypothetical protein
MWPLAYGMAAEQCLTPARRIDWETALDASIATGLRPLRRLLASAFSELAELPARFVDWYGFLVHESGRLFRARARTVSLSCL